MTTGLDWGAIKETYEARLDIEEAQGRTPVERQQVRIREKQARERRAEKQRARRAAHVPYVRPLKYDRARMGELYATGMSTKAVAREMGCDQNTVSRGLQALGIQIRVVSGGRPPADRCKREHDMSETRRFTPKGAAYCYKCVAVRQSERVAA